jgi:hypothetical protein
VIAPKAEPIAPGAPPGEEQNTMEIETMAKMPLESLLYYVLVGDGKKKRETAGG